MEADRSILNIIRSMSSTASSGEWISRWNDIRNPGTEPAKLILKNSHFLRFPIFFLLLFFLSGSLFCSAQKADTLKKRDSIPAATVDSLITIQHSPRKAAIRSAIIPGWGQAYNKKYWKIPIIYAALGITGYIFVDNLQTYKDLKFAYAAKYAASVPPYDSTNYWKIDPRYAPISMEALKQGRDQFRRYIDYSVIFFVIFWGLNIVDAVVDAHLKAFDISPDLSLKIKPSYNPIMKAGGVSFVFNFKR